VELADYDPWAAIGGATGYASFMKRARGEKAPDWEPALEAYHDEDDLVLRYDVPGVDPADLDLRVDGRVLTVRGVRRRSVEVPAELSIRDEHAYGAFDRGIALPAGTDPAGVRARHHLGVLEIRVAHVRRAAPSEVPVVLDDEAVEVPVRADP
jgi:HSP20 family protein